MNRTPERFVLRNARLCSLDGDQGYRVSDNAALACQQGRIAFVGVEAELPDEWQTAPSFDCASRLLTPGLIDCHTHLVFAGQRAGEFEQRLLGVSYEQIARSGGGILSSVLATRAASEDELLAESLPRAQDLLGEGVTTLEIKSGYGLETVAEARMLHVARRIGRQLDITVRTSFLGAHALPPEFAGRANDYIDHLRNDMLPALHRDGLVDAVDAYCERIGFTPAQTRRLFEGARALGLPVKLHADQLSDCEGASIVAEFDGLSADHVEYSSPTGVEAMARAGSVAVLLPAAFYCLRETRLPPIEAFRAAGVPMAVASDLNPGTAPQRSLRLAMNQACTLFRLSPEEALRGVTVNAARALGLSDRGMLAEGMRADLALWDVRYPAELSYWIGGSLLRASWSGGHQVAGEPVAQEKGSHCRP